MKQKFLCCVVVLFAFGIAYGKTLAQEKGEIIAGVPVEVISDYRSSFKIRFIVIVIAKEAYSKENLISIWRHYCDKYDKKDRLDLRVYLNQTHEYNRRFEGWIVNVHTGEAVGPDGIRAKLRSHEASFKRMGNGALASGGDNELMIYMPDPDNPEVKERIVLAGKDPFDR